MGTGRLDSPRTPPVYETTPPPSLISEAEFSSFNGTFGHRNATATAHVTPRIATSGK